MASGVTLKAAGLNISPNPLEVPPGSLVEANNVIIRRDNVIESRRGFSLYGVELPNPAERVKQLLTYKQRILRHYSNKLQFQNGLNNAGIPDFQTFPGDYSETEAGLRIKGIEVSGNFYFTTSEGIKKLSAANSDQLSTVIPSTAGIAKAIDLQAKLLTVLGDQESFFTQNGVVAYRVLWGKKDANNNLILGAPSESVQLYNPLTQLLISDFNNLLNRLDILKDNGSMIGAGDYAQSLALGYTDTATELEDALINPTSGLFAKLDQDILYADDDSTPAAAPLTILSGQSIEATITIASPAVITTTAPHGLLNDTPIYFATTGALPTGLSVFTTYYVKQATSNTFRLSTTISPGTLINTSGSQSGVHRFVREDSSFFESDTLSIALEGRKETVTISNGTPGVITLNNHGLSNGNIVYFTTTGTLPSPLAILNKYYVVNATTNTFNVESSIGGGAINTTTAGSGVHTMTIKSVQLNDYFGAAKNLNLLDFENTNGVSINSNFSVISVDDVDERITFTVNAPSITITSFDHTTGTIVTASPHNLTASVFPSTPSPVGLRVIIQGVTSTGASINGVQTVTSIESTTSFKIRGTFTTSATGGSFKVYEIPAVKTSANTKIESYQYRSIRTLLTISEPPSQAQLLSLQNSFLECITRLQDEQSAVIPITARNEYIDDLGETTSASVQLEFSIPEGIDTSNFYQVYRTAVTVPPDTESLSSFNAGDEMALVYESFPTSAEISAKKVVLVDETPDIFRGANLYTNPTTGEGILQANDQPPFAKDINTFKNSVFYANTKTKQRFSLSLIGVEQMIQNYDSNDTPNVIITDGVTSNQYEFILGQKETTRVEIDNSLLVSTANPASYFTLNSAGDLSQYYIWYKKGLAIDPNVSGKVGIKVDVIGGDTSTTIATKTVSALAPYVQDFTIIKGASCTFDISNSKVLSTNHGLANGQTVKFNTTGVLPGGVNNTTVYYVINRTTNDFQIDINPPPSAVPISFSGTPSGAHTYEIQASPNLLIQNTNEGVAINPSVKNISFNPSSINITSDTITINSHGFIDGDVVRFSTTGTLPNPLSNSISYYIVNSSLNTFQLSLTSGGLAIDLTTIGSGVFNIFSYNGLTITTIIDGIGEDPSVNQVLLSQSLSPSIAIEETAKSLVRVINRSPTSDMYAYYISGITDTPGRVLLEKRTLNVNPFYIVADSTTTGDSFTPVISPKFAVSEVFDVITSPSSNVVEFDVTEPHGFSIGDRIVVLDTDSAPTYNGIYTITATTTNTFSILSTTVVTPGKRFSVSLASDSEFSSNEEQKHRIYYSKTNQPEAVPILNYFDVGASDKKILRIFPLRDSLFVFKEDGLFRVSGESPPFVLGLFDSSCIAVAADSLGVSNNLIYTWTTQGISAISEAGVSLASRPIDTEILEIASSRFTNFSTATFGVGYESDNSYIVWTVARDSDTTATQAYRYSNLTSSWTKFDLSKTCAVVNPFDDRLYLGASDVGYIEQERKLFNRTDYADRQFNDTIGPGAYNNKVLQLTSVVNYSIGDVVVQEQSLSIYDFNSLLKKLDQDPSLNVILQGLYPSAWQSYFYNTFVVQNGDNLRTAIVALASFLDTLGLTNTNYLSSIASYSGSIVGIAATNPTVVTTSLAHNLSSGRVVLLSGTNSTRNIDGSFVTTVINSTQFSIPLSVNVGGTTGSWITDIQNFKDIQTCYNTIIDLLNSDGAVSYSNYRKIDYTSTQETSIVSIDRVLNKVTLKDDLNFVEGVISVYKSINSSFTYAPASMGNPLSYKQIREATMMFIDKRFTSATMSFSSDLLPGFIDIQFNGNGAGLFGNDSFGTNFFGGVSNSSPFRTYVPKQCQRCRYLNIKFKHNVAREKYGVLGITLTGNVEISTRAYR